MKQYVVDEKTLRHLLYCEMQVYMLESDGVDNWSWYGASHKETKKEFYPGDWDELDSGDKSDLDFSDIAIMRIEAGEFCELSDIPESIIDE